MRRLWVIAVVVASAPLWAQIRDIGTLETWYLRSGGDTVVETRSPSMWRIGPLLSGTLHLHYGNLVVPANLVCPSDGYLRLSSGGFGGGGLGLGAVGVFRPQGTGWGAALTVSAFDVRQTSSVTKRTDVPTTTSFELDNSIIAQTVLRYLTFMPEARYWFEQYPGLHVVAGLDVDVLLSSSLRRLDVYYEAERIDVQRKLGFDPNRIRIGGHVGAGWDLFAGLIGGWRMTLTPFVTIHVGTPLYSANGSSWNSVYARGGVSLTFGRDAVTERVLPRNPNVPQPTPPPLIALQQQLPQPTETAEEIPIAMLLPIAPEVVPSPSRETPIRVPVIRIVPNQVQVFSGYRTPFDTALTDEMKQYLDVLADYLREHPTAEVHIVGHTDNFGGSPQQTQRISDERALQVVRYLMNKGIPRERLLASGMGARNPIASNRTVQGRLANRRVEITVVQR